VLTIKHRINTLQSLRKVPQEYGVELDLHYSDGKVYVGHDPNDLGISFESYLSKYRHAFMAVNVKEEGIEDMVLETLQEYKIEDFFLFDLTFPSIFRLKSLGESRIAVRISDFENIRDFNLIRDKVQWLWIDVFQSAHFLEEFDWLQLIDFKKCFVSPELHLNRKSYVSNNIRKSMLQYIDKFDAVCTKDESLWKRI